MEGILLRRASEADMPCVLELIRQAFTVEQGIPEELNAGFLSLEHETWAAEMDGRVIGTVSAWKENGQTHWGRFAVEPALRGQHIGTALARRSFDDLFAAGTDTICAEARDTTVHIFLRAGGRVTGPAFHFCSGNCTPVVLEKEAFLRSAGNT